MNRRVTRSKALLFTAVVVVGCSREQEGTQEELPETRTPAMEMPASSMPAMPADVVAAVQMIDSHLMQARAQIATDGAAAAAQIRHSAEMIRQEAARSTGESRARLENCARMLDRLAEDVEKRAVTSERDLDREYARVHHELSREFERRAREAWMRKDMEEVGRDLSAAAGYLERSLRYAGREADDAAQGVVRDARALGDKLAKGADWTEDEVERSLDAVAKELDRISGHRTQPLPRNDERILIRIRTRRGGDLPIRWSSSRAKGSRPAPPAPLAAGDTAAPPRAGRESRTSGKPTIPAVLSRPRHPARPGVAERRVPRDSARP